MSAISDLLTQSRDAHGAYRDALPHRVTNGSSTVVVEGDAEAAGVNLSDACRFRADAHVLDPDQTDPAWADERTTHPHAALLEFYVAQLSAVSPVVESRIVEIQATREAVALEREPVTLAVEAVQP